MFDEINEVHIDPNGYQHRWIDGAPMNMPVGKVVCVGRNYADHAKELGNDVPDAPILFMKPATALTSLHEPLVLPEGQGPVHHEVEMVVLIGKRLCKETRLDHVRFSVAAYGIGLDLTLREVQKPAERKRPSLGARQSLRRRRPGVWLYRCPRHLRASESESFFRN